MSTVTIISDFYNPNNPKCRSCIFYEISNGNWTSGKCVSETTKVKDRNRWDNSKACGSHKFRSNEDFWKIVNEQREQNN